MKTVSELNAALRSIRENIDADVMGADIDSVKNKLLKLTQLIGLSAECQAACKNLWHQKELKVLNEIDTSLSPSIQAKRLSAECFNESSMYEYADRLNSAIIHTIDSLRTIISLYKSEMENSLKQ